MYANTTSLQVVQIVKNDDLTETFKGCKHLRCAFKKKKNSQYCIFCQYGFLFKNKIY